MSPLVLQYVLVALQSLPALLAAGATVESEVASIVSDLKMFQAGNVDPTAEQWAAQNMKMSSALNTLLATKPA